MNRRRLLLLVTRIYPKSFRAEYGDDLLEFLEAQYQESRYRKSVLGRARFWLDVLVDALRTARRFPERRPHRRERRSFDPNGLVDDARVAARSLSKRPGFTAVVLGTLALGIGANAAIFSVVQAVLLRPLPYAEPERLVRVWSAYPEEGELQRTSSQLDVDDWRAQNDVFDAIAAYPAMRTSGYVLTGSGDPVELTTTFVSPDFFETFAVPAALGRTLAPGDHVEGENRVVVLSHGSWQRRFGADPAIAGRSIVLRDQPFTVIGVMPPRFDFPSPATELWAPLSLIPESGVPRLRFVRWLHVVARLKRGVGMDEAEAAMTAIAGRLSQAYPDSNKGLTAATLRSLDEVVLGPIRPALLTVFGAVGLVLLIVCVNVANLLLVRSEGRSREVALRAALGGGRARIARAFVVESLLLATLGGLLGLALADVGLRALLALAPGDIPRLSEVRIDAGVLGFTAAVTTLVGVVVGLAPVLARGGAALADLNLRLKEGGRGAGSGRSRRRVRGALVVVEVALVVVLAVSASLLVRSYARLSNVPTGLVAENLLTMDVTAQMYKYRTRADYVAFFTRVLDRLAGVPGVRSAALVRPFPLRHDTFDGESFSFRIEGKPLAEGVDPPEAALRFVSPGYFRTMGIPLLAGRDFDRRDDAAAPFVVIVDRVAAERYWPGEDPVGARLSAGDDLELTVVGVVSAIQQTSLAEPPGPALYMTYTQNARVGMTFVLRTEVDPVSLVEPVQAAIWEVDPDQPIGQVAMMERVLEDAVARPRFSMALLGLFAGLALVLAAVGIYGVVSYGVGQRLSEFGVRLAFGAGRADVVGLVLREGLLLTGVGILAGMGLSLAAARVVSSLLFEVTASDPASYAVAIAILGLTSLAACLVPAWRAARIDPIEALRYE